MPLPHLFSEDHDENEDERRLFFVGLTRARKKIYGSFSETDFSGRDKNPSLFWHELPEENTTELPRDETEESAQRLLPSLMTSGKDILLTDGEKDILKEKVQNFVWSASSLQTYLNCPRQFLFQRLYQFPRRPSDVPQLALGTALHEAIERGQRYALQNNNLPLEQLLTEFDRALRGQSLLESQFEKFLAHGKEILTQYLTENREKFFDQDALMEYNFGQHSPSIENIRITGKVDRIEFLDPDKKQIVIIDYKSGRPKPIKSGENYWRQLVFYDLLVRYSKPIHWEVVKTELRFLTPDANGKLGTRDLKISDTDRAEVIAELKEADQKLKNLEFPLVENPTQDSDIDFWQNFGKESHGFDQHYGQNVQYTLKKHGSLTCSAKVESYVSSDREISFLGIDTSPTELMRTGSLSTFHFGIPRVEQR
ncbi:hypothetical protein HC823_01635, partial [Candidatus Gracilibacteria bacterium]|nr:hypothetical protein [Candidatus Gracilibacteria bacterium]